MAKISTKTKLTSLNLPYLELILKDVYFMDFDDREKALLEGLTPVELAASSRQAVAKVIQDLYFIRDASREAALEKRQCYELLERQSAGEGEQALVFDLRYERQDPIPSAQPFDPNTFRRLVDTRRPEQRILFVCEDGAKSYAASLHLRQLGMKAVYYLEGGAGGTPW